MRAGGGLVRGTGNKLQISHLPSQSRGSQDARLPLMDSQERPEA